jgi:hypothetical protein
VCVFVSVNELSLSLSLSLSLPGCVCMFVCVFVCVHEVCLCVCVSVNTHILELPCDQDTLEIYQDALEILLRLLCGDTNGQQYLR